MNRLTVASKVLEKYKAKYNVIITIIFFTFAIIMHPTDLYKNNYKLHLLRGVFIYFSLFLISTILILWVLSSELSASTIVLAFICLMSFFPLIWLFILTKRIYKLYIASKESAVTISTSIKNKSENSNLPPFFSDPWNSTVWGDLSIIPIILILLTGRSSHLIIEDKDYDFVVKREIFKAFNKGDIVEVVYLPRSKQLASIRKLT